MSRTLQTSLILLALLAAFYFAVCSANEVYDLVWKVTHNNRY